MGLEQLINDYKQWVLANPTIYRASHGTPSVVKIVPTLDSLGTIAEELFLGGASVITVTKQSNSETLDGLVAWYNYVYLPSQA